eukprot:1149731-Pelagomonas_calceolata.AAC.9
MQIQHLAPATKAHTQQHSKKSLTVSAAPHVLCSATNTAISTHAQHVLRHGPFEAGDRGHRNDKKRLRMPGLAVPTTIEQAPVQAAYPSSSTFSSSSAYLAHHPHVRHGHKQRFLLNHSPCALTHTSGPCTGGLSSSSTYFYSSAHSSSSLTSRNDPHIHAAFPSHP